MNESDRLLSQARALEMTAHYMACNNTITYRPDFYDDLEFITAEAWMMREAWALRLRAAELAPDNP